MARNIKMEIGSNQILHFVELPNEDVQLTVNDRSGFSIAGGRDQNFAVIPKHRRDLLATFLTDHSK